MDKLLDRWVENYRELLSGKIASPGTEKLLIGAILIACLGVRLWTIGAPALDRTTWKEIDYIAVSTNYWKHGFNFFHPEISWPADPPRYTAMELPLVPYAAAGLYQLSGYNVYTVRVITLLAFLLMSLYVYRLAKRECGATVGLLAGLASAIVPLYHSFGRYLFSEPAMIATSVIAIFHYAEWVDHERIKDWVLAWLGFTLAVALKLEPLYLVLPLLWITYRKHGREMRRYQGFALLILFALILPLAWYSYAYYLSRTSIDVFGIFGGLRGQGHNKFQTLTMLTSQSWYQTMYRRITGNVLGGMIGSVLCLGGLIASARLRKGGLFVAYLVTILSYFAIVAEGQIDAPYRQLAIIPCLAFFVALGALGIGAMAMALLKSSSDCKLPTKACLVGCTLLLLLMPIQKRAQISAQDAWEPNSPDRWALAQHIRSHCDSGSKLIALGEYSIHVGGNDLSPVLYYYSGLQGWTLRRDQWSRKDVEALIRRGATHFAARQIDREPESAGFLREMKEHFEILYEGDDQLLLNLRGPVGGQP